MFIKFEGRLINTDQLQVVEISHYNNTRFNIDFYLRNRTLEIHYEKEGERDEAFRKLEELLKTKK